MDCLSQIDDGYDYGDFDGHDLGYQLALNGPRERDTYFGS